MEMLTLWLREARGTAEDTPWALWQTSFSQSQWVKTTVLILPTHCYLALFSWSGVSGRVILRPRVYKMGVSIDSL